MNQTDITEVDNLHKKQNKRSFEDAKHATFSGENFEVEDNEADQKPVPHSSQNASINFNAFKAPKKFGKYFGSPDRKPVQPPTTRAKYDQYSKHGFNIKEEKKKDFIKNPKF